MTKIRNTKKGMAKKTLSISLAVAMLATSNVPVWAAEDLFTDGEVAVEAFTADEVEAEEVEAPVVEEEVAVDAQLNGYVVDTNVELQDVNWGTPLSLAKKADATGEPKFNMLDANGAPAVADTIQVWSGNDKLKDVEFTDGNIFAAVSSAFGTNGVGLDAYRNSTTVTVKVLAKGTEAYRFDATVKPVDITGWNVAIDKNETPYNGKLQYPKATVTHSSWSAPANVTVVFDEAKEAKNVGKYHFSVKGTDGYTGTLKAENEIFEISPAEVNDETLSVAVSGTATYNGSNTKATVVVTDLLSGKTIPAELYTSTFASKVGDHKSADVTITLKDKAKIGTDTTDTPNNFKAVTVGADLITGTYKVEALDLSKLDNKYDITVSTKLPGETIQWSDVQMKDKETGKVYTGMGEDANSIAKILPVNEILGTTTNNASEGTATLTLTSKNPECITGVYTKTFRVVDDMLNDEKVAFEKGTVINGTALTARTPMKNALNVTNGSLAAVTYTGSEIKPFEEALSNKLVVLKSGTATAKALVKGVDYDLTYTNNTDSDVVKANPSKVAKVTLTFKGDYAGTIEYTFAINQANATVEGKEIPYVAGKNSYKAEAKVTVPGADGKAVDVDASAYDVITSKYGTVIGTKAEGKVVFNNPNYTIDGEDTPDAGSSWNKTITCLIVGKDLKNCTATVDGTYTYTGEAITPKVVVKDGTTTLVEGVDYKVISNTGINAGLAHATIVGVTGGNYTGSLDIDFTIEKADLANAIVLNGDSKTDYDVYYEGVAQKPNVEFVKVSKTAANLEAYDAVTKKGDYVLTWDEDAVEVGTYNFTVKAVEKDDANVTGEFKGTFKVKPSELEAEFVNKLTGDKVSGVLDSKVTGAKYNGNAITLADFETKYVLKAKGKVLTEGKDYKLVYTNNVDAGKATVKAYGLGNHAAVDKDGKEIVIATLEYYIAPKATIKGDWVKKINDVEYAGGLPVEPQVIIVDPVTGNKLVQGVDYTVTTEVTKVTATGDKPHTGAEVRVKGKGAYVTVDLNNSEFQYDKYKALTWKVVKKDLSNTAVTVVGKDVIVMNGSVVVPSTEYDVVFSEDGKKVTVTAKEDSANYTGSIEKAVASEEVGQAMIKEVKVDNNHVTVVLEGEADNAEGYDYVIATEEDYKNGRVDITKNQLKTTGDFYYVQKGVYYAYCHAWTRDENGTKVFGEWSNIKPFVVTTTTPEQPIITDVTRKGSTVTVTYVASKDATGYDVVLGTAVKNVNGEKRPVEYGTLVKKNQTKTTVTFKNVPAGKYYVGMHAYNRTSVDNKKVFSPWANWNKTVTVK